MRVVDKRMAERLRSRGYVVERVAEVDHGFREFNDYGMLCHAPGCRMAVEDHV